jgi:hypothetical protein
MAKTKPVVLRGIYIVVHSPTEERLSFQIEHLTPEQFRSLAADLEDWFLIVDDKYKKTFVRGRGWKGRGKRVSERSRIRVLRFSPFPSRFANILRTVRRDLYVALHKNCLVLEGEKHGGYRQNIYILPYANAPTFMNEIQTKNKVIDGLNKKINEFMQTRHFANLKAILDKRNMRITLNGQWKMEHITMDATPLALEPTTVKEMVETEYQKMFKKLEKEEQQGLEALHDELERKRKELVVKGVENLRGKIENIIKRIVATKKLRPKTVKEDLARLRKIAVSVGLEAIATSIIDPLGQVIEKPEKAMELFGTKDLSAAVNGRVAGLIAKL